MADRWIVSAYSFHEHRSLSGAKAERERLMEQFPDKTFRLYRIKTHLGPTQSKQIIADLTAEIEALKSRLAGYDSDA